MPVHAMKENCFEPEAVEVQAGETFRFALTNEGELLHQFTLGPVDFHLQQQEEMAMMAEHGMLTATGIDPSMAGMDHGGTAMTPEGPNTVLAAPGGSAELTWRALTSRLSWSSQPAGPLRSRHGRSGFV